MKNECLDRVGVIFYTGSIFYGRIIDNSEDFSEVYHAFVVNTLSACIGGLDKIS